MKNLNLTTLLGRLLTVVLVGAMLGFMGCSSDDDPVVVPTQTIYELMTDNSELSQLKGWIDELGLDASLKGTTATTFFAPNNAAFDKLKATLGVTDLHTVAPSIIESVLKFHFVNGVFTKAQLVAAVTATTEQGEDIEMNISSTNSGTIKTGGSDDEVIILSADNLATNGVMHVIETILIPPTIFSSIGVNLGKLSQAVLLGADFTTLAAGISKADEFAAGASLTTISSILAGSDNYTIFAPSNATFEEGSITSATFTGQEWYGIISNHLVSGLVVEADLTTCEEFTTSVGVLEIFNNTAVVPAGEYDIDGDGTDETTGTGIYIDSNGDVDCTLQDGGASLASGLNAEIVILNAFSASNGVMHVVAGVLQP